MEIKAIKLQPENPFTWASGWKSPIYCDNRKTLSYPKVRELLKQAFAEKVRALYPDVEVIAGVATGAIAVGVLVAEALNLPFIYVRSASKDHGLGNQIEGYFEEGQKVVVIEDLISTGGSSLKAVEALRAANVNVMGMLAIFTYQFSVSVCKSKLQSRHTYKLHGIDRIGDRKELYNSCADGKSERMAQPSRHVGKINKRCLYRLKT